MDEMSPSEDKATAIQWADSLKEGIISPRDSWPAQQYRIPADMCSLQLKALPTGFALNISGFASFIVIFACSA
jgi:hypothetical protein